MFVPGFVLFASALVANVGLAREMPQILTVDGDLILIPMEPSDLFSSLQLSAIAAPDSVDALLTESLPRGFDSSTLRSRDIWIRSGAFPEVRSGRRKLHPDTITKLQVILSDPNNYFARQNLCTWDGEFMISFWKDGICFPITIDNSFLYVREEGRPSWSPIGSSGRLCSIMDEIFPERTLYQHRGCGEPDRDRKRLIDSELRALAEPGYR